jgi:hypothetical protein
MGSDEGNAQEAERDAWEEIEWLVGPELCALIHSAGDRIFSLPDPAGTPSSWHKGAQEIEALAARLRVLLGDPVLEFVAAAHVWRSEDRSLKEDALLFDELPRLLERFAGLSAAARVHLGEVRRGRQPNHVDRAFVAWLRDEFHGRGLSTASGEHSTFPRVLKLTFKAFGRKGGRDLVRKRERRAGTPTSQQQPGTAPGQKEASKPSARGWWGGESPD